MYMCKSICMAAILVLLSACAQSGPTVKTDTITQYGITWKLK